MVVTPYVDTYVRGYTDPITKVKKTQIDCCRTVVNAKRTGVELPKVFLA